MNKDKKTNSPRSTSRKSGNQGEIASGSGFERSTDFLNLGCGEEDNWKTGALVLRCDRDFP